jgi:hypothetical protein
VVAGTPAFTIWSEVGDVPFKTRYPTGASVPPDGDQLNKTLVFDIAVAVRFAGGGSASVVALTGALGSELIPDKL